eukprot:XP_016661220.1 PREDICTED: microtubule-associated protein futsch isoform X5 [Acyrthosiphon pisum]
MGNPSDHVETPLTGGYLLIVLAEPRSAEHKLAILKKLTKGLSCWNYEESGVDIVTEFNAIVYQNIEGEEGKNGEQLFQYASDNLVAEILINPQHSTLVQCVRNLLASFTKYRCIIHAGYSFTENGSWILQDGSFSVTDFLDAYKTAEAQRTIRLHENQIRIELHCSADPDWNQVSRVKGTRFLLNPPEKIVDIESIESIVRWLCDKIEVAELDILLEGSQVVGNIRFSRPTLYVFPAGQGDSALFGINGFNMLIDGGAGRNSCFWGFARHLDRLDAVLLTRLNSSNLEGVASFLKRKTMSSLYPQIGHFFCNFKTRKQISSPNIDAKQDVLSISLIDTAQSIITDLKQLQLRPHLCYRNINLEPINLYHKVGHGKLDMYVLNPSKDSKEVKDFLTKWNEGDQKLFNPTKDLQFPLPNIISVCTLLVWQPANPNTTITRILFPGSSPQNKIFESLERVRHLDFLKHPSCSIKSMSSSTSVTVKSQTTKKTVLEKMIPGETKTVKTLENLEVSTSASNAVIQTAIIPTVPKEGTPKPKFPVETEKPKQSIKLVLKETANAKPKIEHKYSSISAKVNSNKIAQKSTTKKSLKLSSKSPPTDKSSPTTPIENQEKAPKPIKQVIKPKSTSTTTKSPSSTPTKSKKEEANRKVLVSSRTNSGLKRTPINKKETKTANPKITETSLKKDSNIVYKSSLISCNKDKSGEEEDILIVEKVAITPEKLLTPDGKKIIANELDGILTTAKDIVTKEKLSDSGATTAPTMPEDEKITESKKEIEVNESDKKIEEFKKAKDALKTPDEVADLPFHEEADEQKLKVAEKEIESEIETQEIVQVENAEYVLVSLDSSPEVLKRQVLDTVGLLDTELDEDSDKEDEYVETKQSTILPDIDEKTKLIEHLLESSKDLCEITEKIDELKKQNEHEITNHQIYDHLQNSHHDNTKTSNCTQLNKQEKPTQIQEEANIELQEKECIDEQRLNIDNENDKDIYGSSHVEKYNAEKGENTQNLKQITTTQGPDTNLENLANITMNKNDSKASSKAGTVCDEPLTSIRSRSGSKTEEPERNTENSTDKQRSKASDKSGSICDEPLKSPGPDISTGKIKSSSICQEQDKTNNVEDKQESKASSKAGSICEEPVKSPVHETNTSANVVPSRSGSITEELENTNVTDVQRSKTSSKASSICDEPVKCPVHEKITTAKAASSRPGSITKEREITEEMTNDKQGSKSSGKAHSVVEELTISPGLETSTAKIETGDRSSLVSQPLDITNVSVTDKQESKTSSKASSVCDEPVKSPVHETIKSANDVINRSVTVTDKPESIPDNVTDTQLSKASSKASSICDEPVKSPVHETVNTITSRSGSITHELENTTNNVTASKASSNASSVCDEPVKSPVHETITSVNAVPSRSGSITEEPQNTPEKVTDIHKSKTSSKAISICDETVKSPVHETIKLTNNVINSSVTVTDKSESIPDNVTDTQLSKASSKASSICDEPVKSPVHEIVNAITSRSSSITHELENTMNNVTASKASSKASSVCDEPVKSPVHDTIESASDVINRSVTVTDKSESISDNATDMQLSKSSSICDDPVKSSIHETITSVNAVPSRSGSITEEPENTPEKVTDIQKSKTSSKDSSICDETVKSPAHETIESASDVINSSVTITDKSESIPDNVTDMKLSKASSKASSICDEPVKSPVHEIVNAITSRSSSITHELENTTNNITGSKASSKASSVCDEPVKSPIHETITSVNVVPSRSGSITEEPQNTPEKVTDIQKSKTSSKASSVCDEPIKSPIHETTTSVNAVPSRSGSVIEEPENTAGKVADIQESKTSSKASSICDETVKSPAYETIESASDVINSSVTVTDKSESIPDNVTDMQLSKASSKASSIGDEPVKSPVHEIVNAITSRSSSITHELENTTNNITGSKASSKASSVCDEPVKSPIHETITSVNVVPSRSGSITEEPQNTPEKVTDIQKSKTSSKTSSVCDEPIKSPIHETITSVNAVPSRSGSIIEEPKNTSEKVADIQESKTSSKASSICDETVKSPAHETIESANDVINRSVTVTDKSESIPDNITDMQLSIASSICDEPVKSPIHETITSVNAVPSRSGSITEAPENVTDIQKYKASSKASSVCDEPVKSPVHETIESADDVLSRSVTVTDKSESIPDNVTDMQLSKASSKASSVCDEPIKSPIHETTTSVNAVPSRSGSVIEEPENTAGKVADIQESKTSSKASSICDETVKSPAHETIKSANDVINRSVTVTDKPESIPDNVTDIQLSKASSKASSICDETVNTITSRSSSVTHELEYITKSVIDSKASSRASSVCDVPVKSAVHETTTLISPVTSSSNTTSQVSENIPENEIENQGSKASSKSGSVCDELVKSPLCENKKSENTIINVSSSITQEPEIITDNHCSKASSKANSISEEPLKSSELAIISLNGSESKSGSSSVNLEQDITHVSINDKQESGNSSVGQDTECPPTIGIGKHDVESSSGKDSFFQDKNKSSTFSSSSTSSICQEIDTQSSKLSSRKSSIVDESIGNSSKLHSGEKSSSLQESNVYEHNIDNNTKIFNKSGSLCDEMLNLPFNKVTENISNKTYEQVVSPTTTVGNTESKIVNKIESMCEESIKPDNDEICTKEHLVSSTSNLILHETEEEKYQLPRKSSVFEEPQNLLTEDNNTIFSPSDCNKNKSNDTERKSEESKSFGRIGSLCEEIAKFLTDNDGKISTNITSESPCSLIESIPLKSNIDELKVETETLLQLNKNTDTLNKVEKSLQLDDKVKVDEKHDNINEKNTDHSLPVKNITVSNNNPPNISTLLIEENNKTGIMNVAQMVGKNIIDESLTKHTVITDNEPKNLKTVTPIANITSEECISKLSNVLIEDVVKTSDDKNIICDSSITDICMNQPLGVTLNSEDLGVTKDIVMQLKRDVHEALHQCSSDDERPFTPQSESSMSRSAMNIDEDDDDNEDNKIETDDDMPGSPMSTRPSPVQMQLDNRHVEINMDFNKALQEHRNTRGEDLTTTEANGNHVTEIKTTEHDNINQNQGTSSDTVQSWGKPLGLPPVQSINNNGFDPIREWGKPLGLPSPTQPILELAEPQNMSGKTTPKKNVKKIIDNKPIINVMDKDAQNRIRRSESPSKLRSRSSSRMSRINPIYLDLIYVPHHGNSKYVSADFFKRVRARNYVFSGTDPSKEVLNALIEGKQAWEDQDLEVTIIPTYDTDTLGQWVAENEELLTKLKIDLSPSASRCTIKLQDHNTSCSAYRLEF